MNNANLTDTENAAEESLLGACLIESSYIARAVSAGVTADAFRLPQHAELFAALVTVAGANGDLTVEPLIDAARLLATQNSRWTLTQMMHLQDGCGVPSARFPGAVAAVLEARMRRRAILAARRALEMLQAGGESASETVGRLATELHAIVASDSKRGVRSIEAIVDEVERKTREGLASEHAPDTGIVGTGLSRLDEAAGKWRRGELVILAARTSAGKSSLAVQVSRLAAESGCRVLFVTLETRDTSPVKRMTQQSCGVSAASLHRAPRDLQGKYLTALAGVRRLNGMIITEVDHSLGAITSRARVLAASGGLDLVVIDYLQLVRLDVSKRSDTREREVAEISRALKLLAVELDTVVLALSQFSRAADDDERPPRLSHLRESGAIEQDADRVLFIWTPAEGRDGQSQRPTPGESPVMIDVQIIVAKNREGSTPAAWARFHRAATRFLEQ
jgi:replicative DNA helicase